MEVLQIVTFIGLSIEIRTLFAMNCYEEMNYHEKYSYGYDIFCSNLNYSNIDELRRVTVYNEIKLVIDKSNLTQLSSKFFENISKTREIIITQSKLNFSHNSNMGTFEDLYQLELLSITNSNISEISKDFLRGLDNLRVLNISNNDISVIEKGTLKNVENLEKLDLSRNRFQKLNNIPLCEVEQLRRLFLHHNYLTSLKNSSITCLKLLKSLTLDFNRIKELVSLKHLRYLGQLSLSYNKIEDISNTFEGLENLQVLNLEGNQLKVIRANNFRDLLLLQKLNLKNNFINFIAQNTFENLTVLEELNLQNNNLTQIPVFDLKSLKNLILSNNTISLENQFRNLHNLELLNLNHCNIGKLTKEHFQYLNYLEILDLSYNNVILDSYSFYGLHSLTQLYLKGNSLLTLPKYAFQFVTNLEILDISNNRLKHLSNLTFHNLKNLAILNLSYNGLETLEENVLEPLENLRTLDLEGNRLQYIDYDYIISQLSNLKLINIRENQLPCEFLSQMLRYFGSKKINFTVNEKVSYNEENVAGIPCQEYDQLNSSLKETNSMLVNDTKVLNEIYHIAKNDNKRLNASLNTTLLILSLVVLILFISVVGISYRIYVLVKRRGYISDEIELLDARLHKWNNYI